MRKRRLATQAAKEFSRRTGCKILWTEGRSFETFMRDYRNAYTIVTGDVLPHGLSPASVLLKTKHVLERQRQDWLLVIFDLQHFLEDDGDDDDDGDDGSSGLALTSFLPTSSRILMTSSYVILDPSGSLDQGLQLACGLNIASTATCRHVTGFSVEQTIAYVHEAALDGHQLDLRAFTHDSSPTAIPLCLVLSCATVQLLGISTSQYYRLLKLTEETYTTTSKRLPSALNIGFAVTMSLLWDALSDYDTCAIQLLAALSPVDRLDIPIRLLQKLSVFRDVDTGQLLSTMELLQRCGLLEVCKGSDGSGTVNVHLLVFRWLQQKLHDVYEEREYARLVHDWVDVLMDHLECDNDSSAADQLARFWAIAAHASALFNLKPSVLSGYTSFQFMLFLKKVAAFLVDDGLLPNLAGIAITHALNMCMVLESQDGADASTYAREYVHIRQIRAKAYSNVFEYRQAESELLEAMQRLNQRQIPDDATRQTIREIEDSQVLTYISQGKYHDSGRLLIKILAAPEKDASPFKIARRHYWMSIYQRSQDADITALEHSHMAMSYWSTLTPAEQWGHRDVNMLRWVEKHATILISMNKFKGALVFATRLLDRWMDLLPNGGPAVWRWACRVVECYCALDKVTEAEMTVCRVLKSSPIGKIEGECLTCALRMLHDLGELLKRNGRTVEAEGLFRFNLQTAKRRDVKDFDGTSPYQTTGDWLQLVICLLEQGKADEAWKVRNKYQSEEDDENLVNDLVWDAMNTYKYTRDLYEETLDAERQGTAVEWKAIMDPIRDRPALKRAVKMFGNPRRRIKDGRDFASDVDIHNIGLARRSRILQLLDYNLVYLSFANGHAGEGDPEAEEELWCDTTQTVLGEFWSWCECRRKRTRSKSLNPVDLINKKCAAADDVDDHPQRPMKQKLITDWIKRLPKPVSSGEGCRPDCPCIAANKAGREESETFELRLYLWKDDSEENHWRPKHRPRYRKPTPNRIPLPQHEIFTLLPEGDWWWMQSEFAKGESEEENYIIPHAADIPGVMITPPEGETELFPLQKYRQASITKYFEKDYVRDFVKATEEQFANAHYGTVLDDILEDDEDEV